MKVWLPNYSGSGGVIECIRNLATHLQLLGHEVVSERSEADICHGHAFDGSDDVYTSHGVYDKWDESYRYNYQLFNNIARAKVVTTVSHWTAKRFEHLGVSPRIIRNGVDTNSLRKLRIPLSEKRKDPFILWAKNSADSVRNPKAFIEYAASHRSTKFVMTVIPEGEKIPGNIRVIGVQPHEQMMTWIARSLVLVSTGTENFPIQALEAMSVGTPYAALRLGGVSEVEGIVYHDSLDVAIQECLDGHDFIVERQYSEVVQYSWEKIARQYIDSYHEALSFKPNRKVSVVIPVYNYSKFVGRAIDSVLSQTKKPDEIIVVDDGSTDDIDSAMKPYKKKVKFIKKPNTGVSDTRNVGVSMASGEFICCLDADDRLSPGFIEAASKILESDRGIGIAYPGMKVIGENNEEKADFEGREFDPNELVNGNYIPCANLFRKTAWKRVGGYKKINPSWEDYDLWLSICEAGFTAKLVSGTRLIYMSHDKGRTGQEQSGNFSRFLRAVVDGYHPRLYGNSASVSIIIPCYNQWNYVEEAVESAFSQTYPHKEIILIDDASTVQPTREQLSRMASKYPSLMTIFHQTNMGLSAARNSGIISARGAYILPLDADDKLHPKFIEECMKSVYNSKWYAYTDIFVWHNDGKGPEEVYALPEYNCDALLKKHIHACSILVRRDWALEIGMYDYKMRHASGGGFEDYEFAIRLAKSNHCGVRVPKPLMYYRWRPNSMRQIAEKPDVHREIMRYIWDKHYDIAGGGFTMACCGGSKGSKVVANPTTPAISRMAMEIPEGYLLYMYTGNKTGVMTKNGGKGRMYRYSALDRAFYVHKDDEEVFNANRSFQQVMKQRGVPGAMAQATPVQVSLPEGDDDLTQIRGVTPEISAELKRIGITTLQRFIAGQDEVTKIMKGNTQSAMREAIRMAKERAGV